MIRKLLVLHGMLLPGLFTLAACVAGKESEPVSEPLVPPIALEQDKPRLALVEHVLADYFAQDITTRPTVCASVVEGREQVGLPADEETALILRFEQLAPFARCENKGGHWRDTASQDPALVFAIHSFECQQETRCTGTAGYQAGAAGSLSYRYTMDWLDNEWTFGRDPMIIAEDGPQDGALR